MLILSVAVLLSILAVSCRSDDEKSKRTPDNQRMSFHIGKIVELNAPSVGKIDTLIPIKIVLQFSNGCGQFHKFIETRKDEVVFIETEVSYRKSICTQNMPKHTSYYDFTPTRRGLHEFRFITKARGINKFDTIPVLIDVHE